MKLLNYIVIFFGALILLNIALERSKISTENVMITNIAIISTFILGLVIFFFIRIFTLLKRAVDFIASRFHKNKRYTSLNSVADAVASDEARNDANIIEGAEIPAARPKPSFFAKPPAMTNEFFERLCREHLPETGLDLDLLRRCIDRAFVSRGIADWSRAKGDTYFNHATQRQLDFLASMGWPGKRPRYLGEASCFIETALIIKDYNTRKAAREEKEAAEVAADFTAVWNAATSAGVLAHDDAARLLEIVGRAPKSKNGAALVRELERFMGETPAAAECPASLFTCASEWISSFD